MEGVFIHESSYVDTGAVVGRNTKIWHFSHIMSNAEIGEECVLGQNVFVGGLARIGNRVKIQNNVSIYDKVHLEDDVFCGPSVVFTNVLYPRSVFPRDRETDFLETVVETGASIGANATIVCGTRIGRYAFIGAGATVTRDIGEHVIAYGCPAMGRGWMCKCGEPLVFQRSEFVCVKCQRAYRRDATSRVQALEDA